MDNKQHITYLLLFPLLNHKQWYLRMNEIWHWGIWVFYISSKGKLREYIISSKMKSLNSVSAAHSFISSLRKFRKLDWNVPIWNNLTGLTCIIHLLSLLPFIIKFTCLMLINFICGHIWDRWMKLDICMNFPVFWMVMQLKTSARNIPSFC